MFSTVNMLPPKQQASTKCSSIEDTANTTAGNLAEISPPIVSNLDQKAVLIDVELAETPTFLKGNLATQRILKTSHVKTRNNRYGPVSPITTTQSEEQKPKIEFKPTEPATIEP